ACLHRRLATSEARTLGCSTFPARRRLALNNVQFARYSGVIEVIMVLRGENGTAAFPGKSRNRDGFARSPGISGSFSLGSRLDSAWAPQRCRSGTQPGYGTPSCYCDAHSKHTVDHRAL